MLPPTGGWHRPFPILILFCLPRVLLELFGIRNPVIALLLLLRLVPLPWESFPPAKRVFCEVFSWALAAALFWLEIVLAMELFWRAMSKSIRELAELTGESILRRVQMQVVAWLGDDE